MIEYSKNNLFDGVFLVLLGALVGAISAYASLFFLWAVDYLHLLGVGAHGSTLYIYLENISIWHLFFLPVAGAVIVRMIIQYGMPGQRHHGPADVIAAARIGRGILSIRAGIGSAAASIVSIGSGASVGRYGPAVHLGASVGSWVAQCMKMTSNQNKTLLACGVAGAISASFSAPLAGLVFAHEVILGRFESKSVMPIAISSVVASAIVRSHEFNTILFMLPDMSILNYWEYFLFAVLGITGGGLAVLYMALMHRLTQWFEQLLVSGLSRALLGGLALGVIVIIFPQTFGLGEQVISDALHLQISADVLMLLVLAKLLATSVSFAAGFSGGVFGPALFLGAMMGTAFGLGVFEVTDMSSLPAVYGVVGMGAVISRVIGAPITTILIVFELTGSYALMTAVMVSVVIGGMVTRQLFNQSYFHHQLRMRNIVTDTEPVEQILREMPLRTIKSDAFIAMTDDMTLAEARGMMNNQRCHEACFVVDQNGKFLGWLYAASLYACGDEEIPLKNISHIYVEPLLVFTEDMNVFAAYLKLKDYKGAVIPLVKDFESLQMQGVVYVSDLVAACLQAFEKNRDDVS
jgi:CIC family chloride channel protein